MSARRQSGSLRFVEIDQPATRATFEEVTYLASNPDVAQAVADGHLESGRQHFELYGAREGRRLRRSDLIAPLRRTKMERLKPSLRTDMPHQRRGDVYDFLTGDTRHLGSLPDKDLVSAHPYPDLVADLIRRHPEGLVLDVGAGRRDIYYETVVNLEVVDYDTTDVFGVAAHLPFKDETFDAVICLAVLEHVRDPFACAAEIARVLKPGGELICDVPFLQPLHAFPNHYYNMTGEGLRALFEDRLEVQEVSVTQPGLPIWSLNWFVQSWSDGLPEDVRQQFLSLSVRDLLQPMRVMIHQHWVTQLSPRTVNELASSNTLRARKPRG